MGALGAERLDERFVTKSGTFLKKVRSRVPTQNHRTCVKRLMYVNEAGGW